MNVTSEQVKSAMIGAGINQADHHRCSLCGYMTRYLRDGDELFFDSACDCSCYQTPPQPATWYDAACLINMQTSTAARQEIARRFGLTFNENDLSDEPLTGGHCTEEACESCQ